MTVFLAIKVKIGTLITQPAIGNFLARIFKNRIPAGGCIIDTASPLITPTIKACLFWGLYESAEIRFVGHYLRRDLDVIELGSSLGVVACHIRKRIDATRRLICVEANPDLAPLIKQNLRINGLATNVDVVSKAIDYTHGSGNTALFVRGRSNLAGVVSLRASANRGLKVDRTTLLQILKESRIGNYALVCDIEGAEAGIILRDKEALLRCKLMIIELHETILSEKPLSIDSLEKSLRSIHDFKLVARHGRVFVFER